LVIEIHKISQQQHFNNLEKSDVEKANVFLKNMLGVAFYAVPHVGSQPLIQYICKQSVWTPSNWPKSWKILIPPYPKQQIYQMISLIHLQIAQTFMVFMFSLKPNLLMIMW